MKKTLIAAICLVLSACQSERPEKSAQPGSASLTSIESAASLGTLEPLSFSSDRQKKFWIEKTARALRDGQALGPKDDLKKLMTMSSIEIVDHFMADAKFIDSVLDFNMYFLGKKVDRIKSLYVDEKQNNKAHVLFNDQVYSFPQAVTAAREVAKGGDYFKFFDYRQPIYVQFTPVYPNEPTQPGQPDQPPPAQKAIPRAERAAQLAKLLDETVATLSKEHDKPALCKDLTDKLILNIGQLSLGTHPSTFLLFVSRGPVIEAFGYCGGGGEPTELIRAMKRMRAGLDEFGAQLERLEAVANTGSVVDLATLDVSPVTDMKSDLFGAYFWFDYINSSTNMNRKRGAYILKQYFCDDLTPVGVVAPEQHSSGAHGSEPSCFACHYKLDPISGFFRERGILGHDFGYSPVVVFDDMAVATREEYDKQWKSQAPAGKEWNVGYVRSLQFPQKNDYGSSFEDLFSIIRKSPEVKQCLIRRLYQYYLGETQAVDRGYLEAATDEFVKAAQVNSSAALKAAMKRALHTNAFAQPNPKEDECYDYRPGENPSSRPPCKVAFLFERNCASCHSGESSESGLDLTSWIKTETGMGFRHLDKDGKQLDPKITFKRIIERLETPDAKLKMPLKRYISSQDQQALYLWAQQMGGK